MKHKKDYTELSNKVLNDSGLKPIDKVVFWAVSRFAHGKKIFCFPSEASIAQICGVSVKTIQRAIRTLTDMKYIKVKRRGKMQTNYYTILTESDATPVSPVMRQKRGGDATPVSLEEGQEKKEKEETVSSSFEAVEESTAKDPSLPSAKTILDDTGERFLQLFEILYEDEFSSRHYLRAADDVKKSGQLYIACTQVHSDSSTLPDFCRDFLKYCLSTDTDNYYLKKFKETPCIDTLLHHAQPLLNHFASQYKLLQELGELV